DLMIVLREAENGVAAVTINYGTFIKRLVDFLIIAALVFAAIKMIARLLGLKRREARARADELLVSVRATQGIRLTVPGPGFSEAPA
ncbi:MscL family protein, partial [Thioalkalivibrio sp.]|uniref:MscL family protein n=1 Tax=Thioalkalivibrio sp. TaxID=2093813 RepID=UPI0039769041